MTCCSFPRAWVAVFLLACTTVAVGAGAPKVFVAATTSIYSVDTATAVSAPLLTDSTADFQGVALGPDGLLYACDLANNKIITVDPATKAKADFFVGTNAAGTLNHAQCAIFGANGSLYVTSKDPGSGVWKFGCAVPPKATLNGVSTPVCSPQGPSKLPFSVPGSFVGGQVAITNKGNLLFVDTANNTVYLSQGPGYTTATALNLSGLSGAVGVARDSNDNIYVSNSGSGAIVRCDPSGANCLQFGPAFRAQTQFMKFAADNTLYLIVSKNSSATLEALDQTGAATAAGSVSDPAVGVALPPTNAASPAKAVNGVTNYFFGFSSFRLTANCSSPIRVVEMQTLPATLNGLLQNMPDPPATAVVPAPFNGENALGTVFWIDDTAGASCSVPANDTFIHFLIGAYVSLSNPRIIKCSASDNIGNTCRFTGDAANLILDGFWPLGGPIPGDGSTGGGGDGLSKFFVVDEAVSQDPNVLGTFCGFQSPLTNTENGDAPAQITAGNAISVKFKLAASIGNCKKGPYINSAIALLSIAQVADTNGNPVFVPIDVNTSGNSQGPFSPQFNNNNNQYQLSVSTKGYALGTYSVTITFETNNSVAHSTLFQLVQ